MIITSWRPLGYLGQLKMKEVAIPDDGGDTIACMELDGHILPKMPDLRAIEGLRSVTIHDDDVLICTYPKSVMYGSWFDYVRSWETVKKNHPDLPILTLFYEDIKQNQTREMAKICEFLGVNRSDEFLSRVCQNTSMGHMKSQKKEATVFRKGHIGDWKNWFTVAQNEWFDQLYQEKMKDFPFEFKFTDKEMLNI